MKKLVFTLATCCIMCACEQKTETNPFFTEFRTEYGLSLIHIFAVLRIVAQTNGIDIVLLHQFKVFAHQFFGNIVTGCFVVLVNVQMCIRDRSSGRQPLPLQLKLDRPV